MAFNAYDAAKMITEYKTRWHEFDKEGDKKKAQEYAELAKNYYKQLEENGYKYVADTLHNTNDVGAKAFLETFKKNTTPDSSMPEAKDITTADGMIDDTYSIQRTNMGDMKNKYDYLENYNYNYNPYESDEGKAILSRYQYQGKTESDNAVAEGGASNGGNIDSYAAANANRQQLAYTIAGDQAVQNYRNNIISNARNILGDMGTYLQNQEKGMQTTAGMKQTEEQRQFENDETSKNNDVVRKVSISDVTGYVPNEWKVDTSTAQQTESGRQFDKNIDTTKELTERELATSKELTQAELAAKERMNNADNATNLTIADKELSAKEAEGELTWDDITKNVKSVNISNYAKNFINTELYAMWVNDIQKDIRDVFTENLYNEKTNPNGYKLTRDDAKLILYHMFDITTEFKDGEKVSAWLNKHTWYNPDAKSDEYTPE